MPFLEAKGVTKIFRTSYFGGGGTVAVEDASFSIEGDTPKIITLAGESGSGKTTMAKLILRLEKPTSGSILWRGKNLEKLSRKESSIYIKEVQGVFQDPYAAFNPLKKADHLLDQAINKMGSSASKDERVKMKRNVLEAMQLSPEKIIGKYPHELSGGERQRVMIARALLPNPRLLVADEPVSMIDVSLRAPILKLLSEIKDERELSILYITHDLSTAYTISDEIIIMHKGNLVEMGDIGEVLEKPAHPYTKLLIECIPIPDPAERWTGRIKLRKEEYVPVKGCKFYPLCPERSEICKEKTPQFNDLSKTHKVRCHLFE